MKSNDINFINYTPRMKGKVTYLLAIVIMINIFIVGNFLIIFSDIYKNYINLRSGQYTIITGEVMEATYFSDTSSSLKVKYEYFNNIVESRVISNKYYSEGSKVELLLNKNDNKDISITSLNSTYSAMEWVILVSLLLDIILVTNMMFLVKKKNMSKVKNVKYYYEIKNINLVMLSKNTVGKKPIAFFDDKYLKHKKNNTKNKKIKKVFIYFSCIATIVFVIVKFSIIEYENYIINNSSDWDIISAKVSEINYPDYDNKIYEPQSCMYTFDFYYNGIKQRVSLKSIDTLKDGDMVELAIKNGDIATVRKAGDKVNIANYLLIIFICIFFMYIAYDSKKQKYQLS